MHLADEFASSRNLGSADAAPSYAGCIRDELPSAGATFAQPQEGGYFGKARQLVATKGLVAQQCHSFPEA